MAQVYLALDQRLGREVAVKILDEQSTADPEFVERFRREARAAAGLNHPNIVAIYDWGPADDSYCMIMEYVDGPNLKEMLRRRGALPEEEVLQIGTQVAAALQQAHEHGVIHRDVKPANILLAPNGRIKVADFGIARAVGLTQLTKTNMLTGTAQYMSPEQAQLKPLDGRSDVYSLGIVLYELLTDSTPFTGESMVEIALQHVHGEIPPLEEIAPEISPATRAIVEQALEKDPDYRFQSAGDLQVALEEAARSLTSPAVEVQTIPARPASRPAPAAAGVPPPLTPEPKRKRRGPVLLLGILALLTLGGGAGAVFALDRPLGGDGAAGAPATRNPASGASPTSTRPLPERSSPALTLPAKSTSTALPVRTLIVPANQQADPVQTVSLFYAYVLQTRFDQAARLWSPAMQQRAPPLQFINQRFADTTELAVRTIPDPTSDPSTGSAKVDVWLTETDQPPGGTPQTVHWQGYWTLIKVGGKWLMDSEFFH
jgi:hypothetical protein